MRRTVQPCWNFDAGSLNAKSLNVEIRLYMNPDGTVRATELMDPARAARDSFYRSAAESARRAVMNPGCNKLPLPPGNYDQWRTLILNFDPRDFGL